MRLPAILLFLIALLTADVASGAQPFTVFVVEGDSLFSSDNGYSNWTQFFPRPYGPLFNNAEGGDSISNIVNEYGIEDHPVTPPPEFRHFFFLEGGVNDLIQNSASGDDVYSNALVILSFATSDHYSNILCTITPSVLLNPGQETERKNYNALVRGGTNNGGGYRLLDIDAIISTNTSDTNYYQGDGLHWTVEFEHWLGIVIIPALLGYSAPDLAIDTNENVSWNSVAYATNVLLASSALVFSPGTAVTNSVSGESVPLSFPGFNGPRQFFRLRADTMDFQTFYATLHPPTP